jgi:hypothetical protein
MKLSSRSLLTFLITALLFSACEREISFENGGVLPPVPGGGGSSSGTSIFSFAGGAGNCTGAVVNGTYTAGVAVGSSNTVVISVLVDSVGTYAITTSTVNGISFSASGNFTTTGAQSITLTGSGTPTTAGSYNYTTGSNGCIFSLTIIPGTTVPPTGNCKECEYVPTCIGSMYKYQTDNFGVAGTFTSRYISATDTVVGGLTYSKMNISTEQGATTSSAFTYVNCSNGVSTTYAYNVVGVNGTTVAFLRITGLKANEPVGASWSEVIQNQLGEDITNTYTIEEKGISRTVLGTTYPDVIHVHLVQSYVVSGVTIEAGTSEYYYAKGVGLVEFTSSTFGITSSRLLESYFIP